VSPDLADRFPGVRHFIATILLGSGALEEELADYVRWVSGAEVVRSMIAEIRALLTDPDITDDAIDEFMLDNAQRFIAGSGRRTLDHVTDRLQQLLDDPPAPHPLTLRAPTLAAFLTTFTRRRGDFDTLVRAGAVASGADVTVRSAEEGTILLQDAALTNRELATFVRSCSWWLLDDSGHRTIEQVVAVLRRPATAVGHDEAKVLAEVLLDRDIRPTHQGEIVIVDDHTQESDTTWAFVYNSRDYVETGSFLDMVVGNAPILVDKATGHTHLGRSDLSVAEQIAPARPPMSNALTARFPEIVYLLRPPTARHARQR
jgi:hypothetical protein